jgi:pSer/pThr/pTyr-binding forkhead associated (FHA) protein
VPPFALTVLKFLFLALLYFFVYRAIRAVAVDLRAAEGPPAPARGTAPRPGRAGKAAKGKPPKAIAVLGEGGRRVETIPLDGTLQIGRAEACQIRVEDTYVSSFHARLFSRDGAWHVEDLGSTNGTYLNQRRVTAPAEVRAGDRVRVGKTTLELRR